MPMTITKHRKYIQTKKDPLGNTKRTFIFTYSVQLPLGQRLENSSLFSRFAKIEFTSISQNIHHISVHYNFK